MAQSTAVRLPTSVEWKQQILEDIELQSYDAGLTAPPTAKGSDFDLKATSLGNALAVLTANLVLTDTDADPTRATGAALEDIRVSDGLPEVAATPASGELSLTSTSLTPLNVPNALGVLCPGSLPAKIVGSHPGIVTGSIVPFAMTQPGSTGNLKAGTIVRFTAPINGLDSNAVVVTDMVDGADTESDAKKRRRILNKRANAPAAGNWGHLRQIALSATNAIDDAFVYPALGGSASCKVVLTAPWYKSTYGQSRQVTNQTIAVVSAAFADQLPTDDRYYAVESSQDQALGLRILVKIRSGAASWTDLSPWPSAPTQVSAFTSQTAFRVTCAVGAGIPVPGQNIALWSRADAGFRIAVIQTVTPSIANQYLLTVNGWSGGALTTMTTGLQISPAAGNISAWGDSLLGICGGLSPGEGCYSWQEPRALRHPTESQVAPMTFGARELGSFISAFNEVGNAQIATTTGLSPDRVTPSDPMHILTLSDLSFGVMP